MLEKKDENWEMLKNGRVDGEIGRVDVDNWLKMSRWKDVLKGVKMEKVKLWLGDVKDVEEEGLVVCEAFVGRLVRNMMVVVRSSDMEQQCLKILNRREAGGKHDGRPMYVGHMVSTLEWYAKVWKMLLRFIWRMWKGVMGSEDAGVLFEGRPDFVLGLKEKEVLTILDMRVRELMGVRRERKRRFGLKGKDVWKDEEVKKIVVEVKECLLDV